MFHYLGVGRDTLGSPLPQSSFACPQDLRHSSDPLCSASTYPAHRGASRKQLPFAHLVFLFPTLLIEKQTRPGTGWFSRRRYHSCSPLGPKACSTKVGGYKYRLLPLPHLAGDRSRRRLTHPTSISTPIPTPASEEEGQDGPVQVECAMQWPIFSWRII